MRRTVIVVVAVVCVLLGLVFYLTQVGGTADVAVAPSVAVTPATPSASLTPDPAVALTI